MKIKITESQYQRLVEYEDDGGTSENILKYKESFFKYWDRFGPGITPKMFKIFGLDFYTRYEYKKFSSTNSSPKFKSAITPETPRNSVKVLSV